MELIIWNSNLKWVWKVNKYTINTFFLDSSSKKNPLKVGFQYHYITINKNCASNRLFGSLCNNQYIPLRKIYSTDISFTSLMFKFQNYLSRKTRLRKIIHEKWVSSVTHRVPNIAQYASNDRTVTYVWDPVTSKQRFFFKFCGFIRKPQLYLPWSRCTKLPWEFTRPLCRGR